MQDLLGSCLASLEPRLKGRKIKIDIPPNLPLIPMDSVLMAQVLINLLDNALKYSPPDGYHRNCRANPGKPAGNRSRGSGPGNSRRVPETGVQ